MQASSVRVLTTFRYAINDITYLCQTITLMLDYQNKVQRNKNIEIYA